MLDAHRNAAAYEAILEEGREAFRDGKNSWENPYDYRWQAVAANAWDDGFRAQKKEAA